MPRNRNRASSSMVQSATIANESSRVPGVSVNGEVSMFRSEGRERRARTRWRPRTLAGGILLGFSVSAMGGLVALIALMAIMHSSLRDLAVMNFLVFFPAWGCAAGYVLWREGRLAKTSERSEAAGADAEPDRSTEDEALRQARR